MKQLHEIQDDPYRVDDANLIRAHLEKKEREKIDFEFAKSKEEWFEKGEKPTKYFYNTIKARKSKKYVKELKLDNNHITCEKEEIL